MKIDKNSTTAQSKAAYKQWCKQWREHAEINSQYVMKPLSDFHNYGVGRSILLVGNGYSFEQNIDEIKKYQDSCDIMACDKTLGHLLDNGIVPDFCMVCDANVNYERYMEKYKDQLKDTILFMSVCANPKWSGNGNWKDKYFFVNKDVIDSHIEFSKISGCKNLIPAATNVSNEMVVLLNQSDNESRNNFFGYDMIGLVGFDYSWKPDGNYYAFNQDGDGKYNYMRHQYITNHEGDLCYSSNNLMFSAKWLETYVKVFNVPVVQCTKNTILNVQHYSSINKAMTYNYKTEDKKKVKSWLEERNKAMAFLKEIDKRLVTTGLDHYNSFVASV